MASLTTSQAKIYQDSVGVSVALVGVGTAWTAGTPGTPAFTATGATITAQTIVDGTHATLTLTLTGTRTATITDPSTGATVDILIDSPRLRWFPGLTRR